MCNALSFKIKQPGYRFACECRILAVFFVSFGHSFSGILAKFGKTFQVSKHL